MLFLIIHYILRFHDDGMILGIANVEIKDRMLWLVSLTKCGEVFETRAIKSIL